MINKLTDKQLAFGKILVLKAGHGMSLEEIKEITQASNVKNLNISPRIKMARGLLYYTTQKMLHSKGIAQCFDLYFVKGRKATSIFTALSGDSFIGAYCWSANEIKSTHNHCALLRELEISRNSLAYCLNAHQKASSLFARVKKPNIFTKHTRALRNLDKNYGVEDIASLKKIINGLLVNRW